MLAEEMIIVLFFFILIGEKKMCLTSQSFFQSRLKKIKNVISQLPGQFEFVKSYQKKPFSYEV